MSPMFQSSPSFFYYLMSKVPLPAAIWMTSPSIILPASLTSNLANVATSSGITNLFIPFSSEVILSPSLKPINPVAVEPGAIELTFIPYGMKICAKPSVKPFNPHLEIPYGDHAGSDPLDEDIRRILPFS